MLEAIFPQSEFPGERQIGNSSNEFFVKSVGLRAQASGAASIIYRHTMADSFVAVVVTVPEEYFKDEDDICLAAGNFVCGQLESHLVQHGHAIPNWIQGGCDEDWGVYFESILDETAFRYHTCFFPSPLDIPQYQLIIQYHVRLPFIKRLFRRNVQLLADDPMHETMRTFGDKFRPSRMLTVSQFESEY